MYTQCRDYLVEKLKEAGIQSTPITSMKKLRVYPNPHVGAVLPDEDTFERNGSKRKYRDGEGAHRRQKIYDRNITFAVIIGDFTAEKVEGILERFLAVTGKGFYLDGNFTYLDILSAEWAEEDDSILKSKVAVNLEVQFRGGVYADAQLTPLPGEIAVQVEKIPLKREENTDGEK